MHDTKERLSLLGIFALLTYLYADVVALVRYCRLAKFIRASPSMGSDGFGGLDGDTHRYDSGVETASI